MSAQSGLLVLGIVLAKFLNPTILGQYGVGIVALIFIQSTAGLGIGRLIAAWRDDPAVIAPTALTISVLAGGIIYGGIYALAPAFTTAMGAPETAAMVRLLALTAVIRGAAAVPWGVLQRRAPTSRIIADHAGNWVGVTLTVGLSVSQFGLISLAVGSIAGCLISTGLLAAMAPEAIRVGFSRNQVSRLLRAALPFAVSGALLCAIGVTDLMVVGHLLQARLLGTYLLALCCASWPVITLSQPVRSMMTVALTRFQRSPKIADSTFRSLVRLLACLTVPAAS